MAIPLLQNEGLGEAKVCSTCFSEHPLRHFNKNKSGNFSSTCRHCFRAVSRAKKTGVAPLSRQRGWCPVCTLFFEWEQGPGSAGRRLYCSSKCSSRAAGMKEKYGLSAGEFWSLYEEQAGLCGMPGCFELLPGYQAEVDHCHEEGHVRGLLCHGCNVGLGGFEKMASFGASEYLGMAA